MRKWDGKVRGVVILGRIIGLGGNRRKKGMGMMG